MELTLDELISQSNHRGGRSNMGRSRGGGGGFRGHRGFGRPSYEATPTLRRGGGSGFRTNGYPQSERAAPWSNGATSAEITITNLDYRVSDADIIELFGGIGSIRYASVHYDRSGRSLGKADVIFNRWDDAQIAIQKYNGVPLDGRPMVINWTNPPPVATFVPRSSGMRQVQAGRVGDRYYGGFRGGGNRGSGGWFRGQGSRGRGGGRGRLPRPTAAELDAELEAYKKVNARNEKFKEV